MPKKRVVVVANKWWECDPMMNVLLHDFARDPDALGWPEPLNHPRRRAPQPPTGELPAENPSPQPRAIFRMSKVDVEVWCISDLLEHLPDKPKFQSSSEVKSKYLPRVFAAGPKPSLVIAFGTAGYPDDATQNGSVVVGSEIFMHNSHPKGENQESNWAVGPFDTVVHSSLDIGMFNTLTVVETSPKPTVLSRFLVEPLNPASVTMLLARSDYVAVGALNVTDYTEYTKTDDAALSAFKTTNNGSLARSLDTTHGLIRIQSDAAFLFISGITDRVGHFSEEVAPRSYAQNFGASHNAGVVLAWLLVQANRVLA